jgi:4-hydroxy-3-polyprenylbenzoate decarboxylase
MRKIVVGISGATGVVYGVRMLKALFENGVETHLVITSSAIRNMLIETEYTWQTSILLPQQYTTWMMLALRLPAVPFR